MPLLCFTHGTELKMYASERRGDNPDEFPLRFLPFIQREKIFDYADPAHGVDVVAAISTEQIEAFLATFPEFPRDRVVLSPNGYNEHVFRRLTNPTDIYADRANVLTGFMTQPLEGSDGKPEPVAPPDGFDAADHAEVPPPAAPAPMNWARLLTKPPGAVLNGECRPQGRKPGKAFVNECSRSIWNTGSCAVAP